MYLKICICFIISFLSSVIIGLNMVNIPIHLSQHASFSNFHKIMLFSLEAIMSTVLALVLVKLLKHIKINRLFILSGFIRIIAILLLLFNSNLWQSYLILILLGMSTFLNTALTQFWLTTISITRYKGIVYSLQGVLISLGIATGSGWYTIINDFPKLKAHFHLTDYTWTSIVCSIIGLLMLMLFAFTRINYSPQIHEKTVVQTIRSRKGIYASVAICGLTFFSVSWYIVVYGIQNGMSVLSSSILLSMFMLGAICIDPIISILGEKWDRRYIMVVTSIVSSILVVFLPIAIYYEYPSYLIMFIWGGLVSSIYSSVLVTLEEDSDSKSALTIYAAFSTMENLGAFVGLIVIGTAFSLFGSSSFVYFIIIANLTYVTYAFYLFVKSENTTHQQTNKN